MIEAIFFDATETLIYLPQGVGWHYAEIAREMGENLAVADLNAAFRQVFRAMPRRPAHGLPRADDDRGWWRELVFRVLDAMPDRASQLAREAYFDRVYERFSQAEIWALYPEIEPVLAALSTQFRLGIISNFDGRLRGILAGLKIDQYFEQIVISSEVGADKPEALIFQKALSLFKLAPDQALHVGDHPEYDWRGAEAVGLHVFRLQRPQNSLMELVSQLQAHPSPRLGA